MRDADPLGDYFATNAPVPQKPPQEEEQEQPWTPSRHFVDESDTYIGLDRDGQPHPNGGQRTAPQTFDLDVVAIRHCRFPCDIPWHRH